MLDGRRATGPRPDELWHADPGARRSRPAAAGLGRRLLHRPGAGLSAHRHPSPGAGQSDHPARHACARGKGDHVWRLRHRQGDFQERGDAGSGARCRSGAGRYQQDAAALQQAPARAQRLHRRLSAGWRQARMPQERSGEGAAQRFAVAGDDLVARNGKARHQPANQAGRRRHGSRRGEDQAVEGRLRGRGGGDPVGHAQAL